MWLGVTLGVMLIGLAILIRKFHVTPAPTQTVLAQVAAASLGKGAVFYFVQLITVVLLALAANTSSAGCRCLPRCWPGTTILPHLFYLRADRQVHRYGVTVLAVAAALLLVAADGNTQRLVPLFAIGVFVGFTLSQPAWSGTGAPNAARAGRAGPASTASARPDAGSLAVELISKFTEGAWLIVLPSRCSLSCSPGCTVLMTGSAPCCSSAGPATACRAERARRGAGRRHVAADQEGISAALSLGDEVVAMTVAFTEEDDKRQASLAAPVGRMGSRRSAHHTAERAP